MAEYIHSVILGIIQGVTEFLPISSSAHLAVFPDILRIKTEFLDSNAFAVLLHAGTLAAVLIYFRERVVSITASFFRGLLSKEERVKPDFRLGVYIIAATLPAVFAGLLFGGFIEEKFRQCNWCIAVILVIFGIILYAADRTGKKTKEINGMTPADIIAIGVLQAAAIFPGVSRSGITMTAALFMGMKREDAAEFSFLLSIPVILGAVVYEGASVVKGGTGFDAGIVAAGFGASFIAGFFAIKFLMSFVKKYSFLSFTVYRAVLGSAIIILGAVGVL